MVDNKTTQLVCKSEKEIEWIAKRIIDFAGPQKVWIFFGEMGAGKTTIIKVICSMLGIADSVNSPTFALVNEYQNDKGLTIYHFDFFRINNEAEAVDIGIDEYFYSGNYCFVEWPSKIISLLPDNYLIVELEALQDQSRVISLSKHE